jgi:murein DD-endopeptidase MepM/ murein hydrolase activator NlpD
MPKPLILKNPAKPLFINQIFGVDKTTYKQFGLDGHNGLDLRAYHGQPLYAAHAGTANYEVDNSQGHGVDIVSTDKWDFGKYEAYVKTRYWHLCDPKKEPKFASPIYKKKNVHVEAGDLIGYADSTGFSTGDHLHFGLKPVDARGENMFPKNGFKGAVDPKPFLEETLTAQQKLIELLSTLLDLLKKKYGKK